MPGKNYIRTGVEELVRRDNNGIHVSLLWNRADDSLKVVVFDSSTDTAFELPVGDASPLDVFEHPYAYAAFRHVDSEPARELLATEVVAA